jgi:hypothetical protein
MNRQITCIVKPNVHSTHEAITEVGGPGFRVSRTECANDIVARRHNYHVKVGLYDVAVTAYERNSTWYIKTKPDSTQKDNLLSLRQC